MDAFVLLRALTCKTLHEQHSIDVIAGLYTKGSVEIGEK